MPQDFSLISTFIREACVPLDATHVSGSLDSAQTLLSNHPSIATENIFTASILGDDVSVRKFLSTDPSLAVLKGGPHEWDPLTHLCFSRYLRLAPERSPGFIRAAHALLDAGANPNSGWFDRSHQPHECWESVLYGAAGVAHHVELTRLLLDHGANPNDDEVPYHAPEDGDNRVTRVLLQSGSLNPSSLTTMLIRKADCHDAEGIELLLKNGANPNHMSMWGVTGLHQSLRRDNAMRMLDMLFDHGADADIPMRGTDITGTMLAARRGRKDVLERFQQKGTPIRLTGVDRVVAACALNQPDEAYRLLQENKDWRENLNNMGGQSLAQFAGNNNAAGVECLLALGIPVDSPHEEGDGYFDVAPRSTALHVASWRAQHAAVKCLLDRGANIHARDGKGRTPLMLAIKACVDSYWMYRRSLESIALLLDRGASALDIERSTGDSEIDALLKSHGARL